MLIEINHAFQQALDALESSASHIFISGKAGTGKSTLLEYFCNNTKKKPVVLAPTGVAAINVKGQTIHRFFNFSIDITPDKIRTRRAHLKNPEVLKNLKVIIIDEVSMLRADLLDCIDTFLQRYGPYQQQPFGGVQMVFIGDLYQLPPVVNNNERDCYNELYPSPYFFSAHALQHTQLEYIELEKVYRQRDQQFVDILNRVRNNSTTAADLHVLNQQHDQQSTVNTKEIAITLTPTNQKADEINVAHLQRLKGKQHSNIATIKGDFGREYYPTATELHYKIGSQIMMLNNDQEDRWYNGSIGIIKSRNVDKDAEKSLRVQLRDNNKTVTVTAHTWEVYTFSVIDDEMIAEPIGSFTQLPMRLAWAVTIHKSQGKTFEKICIDIGRGTFACGQLYVAMSRCTSLAGIRLEVPIKSQHIRTDPTICNFMTNLTYQRIAASFPNSEKTAILQQAIADKRDLTMTYLKPNDSKSTRVITPISTGEEHHNGKTFAGLRVFCHQHNDNRIFHLGRVIDLRKL